MLTYLVSLSVFINEVQELNSYGTNSHCWLSPKYGFIWAFMGPVAVIVVINIIIFIMAMMVAKNAISRNNNMDTKAEIITQMKAWLSAYSQNFHAFFIDFQKLFNLINYRRNNLNW